ncbi:MAG: sigma-54 dependent transcriptional regulator [Hoeflea sp.]|uniref:sigma-54-dependent transcriptional regulator n=1 Tax=Hoeflea sp. TaxID=1940281 RepID=UPI001D73FA21|nr:sigma-54 dependent transcriptional regulator [Hoeflea sp.]MBU4528167.1 sigma-54 dependent transcriptional regulator [Alphaproteobacteria bacterium]MBU4543763.1 sigma-54 dependent transcriptional regulator [Alphaproteobacteria bacterium]MBU4548630.1 sigma-54 dependent transcriptional regulator [Alphaproteobacteria bacterium]MBV1725796.1 sigma-54 dependent transcriptional regulator [Hoeflea sp.]MBV1762152.1 sigma-54 dependent transcriptional regulator [Hoeflea sp.]
MTSMRVLLVDDEPDLRAATAQALDLAGFQVVEFSAAERVVEMVSFGFPGIVLTDIRMPGMDGLTLMSRVHEIDRDIPVILITGHGDVQLAVRAMRDGAHDFVEKPFAASQLSDIVARAVDHRRLVLENRVLRAAAGQVDDLEQRLIGRSNMMIDLRRRIRTIGPTEADVLIEGATGAGKEVVARALHDLSSRANRPLVTIDCAALPATLIESELFGHEPGAFAGALRARYGKFEHARGGTILLDDIASVPLDLQGKLVRVIEERTVTRLGANEPIDLDVRFMATARVPLQAEVQAGRFRADLLYRLNVVTLHVPPLSARREDVPLLFLRLLVEAARRHRVAAPEVPPAVISQLAARDWPGNVRELRNAADRYALGLGEGLVPEDPPGRLAERVAEFERREIEAALAAHRGNLKPVYESLGLSRKTLWEKMQKHGLDKAQFGAASDDGDQ